MAVNLLIPKNDQVQNYADLQALFDSLGATEATLKINKELTLTQNTICPSTISIEMVGAGKIITNGFDYTQNGPFDAPLKQVFDVSGGGNIIGLTAIKPNWWGASPNASAATNNTAFTNSIAAMGSSNTFWELPAGIYSTSQVITFSNFSRVEIKFNGSRIDTSTNNGILFDTVSNSTIHGMDILYPTSDWGVTYYGIKFKNCGTNNIYIKSISRFFYGVYWEADGAGAHYNHIEINQVYDARYGFYIRNINAGSSNENSVYGGKYFVTSAHTASETGFDGAYGIYFENPDIHPYNDWNLYNTNVEGLANGFKLTASSNILLMKARFEGTAPNANEYWIDVYYNGNPPTTSSASGQLVLIMGATTSGFNASKLRLGISRGIKIMGTGLDTSNYETIITDNVNGGMSFFTETNIDKSYANFSASQAIGSTYLDDYFGKRITNNKGYQDATIPTSGTFRENAVVWNTVTGAGLYAFWLCTSNGTMNSNPAGMTVTTTAGSKNVTINAGDINDLLPGQYIDIAGEGSAILQINTIDYDNGTFITTVNATNSVATAALTYHNATWVLGGSTTGITSLADSATPSVKNVKICRTSGANTITNFTNGVEGQEIVVSIGHNTTINDGGNFRTQGSAALNLVTTDIVKFLLVDGTWRQSGMSIN